MSNIELLLITGKPLHVILRKFLDQAKSIYNYKGFQTAEQKMREGSRLFTFAQMLIDCSVVTKDENQLIKTVAEEIKKITTDETVVKECNRILSKHK